MSFNIKINILMRPNTNLPNQNQNGQNSEHDNEDQNEQNLNENIENGSMLFLLVEDHNNDDPDHTHFSVNSITQII